MLLDVGVITPAFVATAARKSPSERAWQFGVAFEAIAARVPGCKQRLAKQKLGMVSGELDWNVPTPGAILRERY